MQSVFCLAYSGIFNQGTLEIHLSPGAAFGWFGFSFCGGAERETAEGKRRRTTLPQPLWTQISVGSEGGGCAHVSFDVFIP